MKIRWNLARAIVVGATTLVAALLLLWANAHYIELAEVAACAVAILITLGVVGGSAFYIAGLRWNPSRKAIMALTILAAALLGGFFLFDEDVEAFASLLVGLALFSTTALYIAGLWKKKE